MKMELLLIVWIKTQKLNQIYFYYLLQYKDWLYLLALGWWGEGSKHVNYGREKL